MEFPDFDESNESYRSLWKVTTCHNICQESFGQEHRAPTHSTLGSKDSAMLSGLETLKFVNEHG